MASIRKRGDRWHVQVRRKDHPPIYKAFSHRKDAEAWVRDTERRLDRGEEVATAADPTTIGELMAKYAATVSPTKRGGEVEQVRLAAMSRHSIGKTMATKVTTSALAAWRDERLKMVSAGTVLRELGLLHRVLVTARHEWGMPITLDAFEYLSKPKQPLGRVRRLPVEAVQALLAAARESKNRYLAVSVFMALETGMRRGEIVAIQWSDVDFQANLIHIAHAKNGFGRSIPMTAGLRILLQDQHGEGHGRPVAATGTAIHQAFEHARERARKALQQRVEQGAGVECQRALVALEGLRFHDLRHEAISRFFEKGLTMVETAEVSGHRTLSMLKRYAHADLQPIAKKLAAQAPSGMSGRGD